uniref:Uncharacterized protein n=1 Tax=Anguilla anguilla TaxID=7936 RepID=A0A0E9UJ51_ANGAN
MKLCSEFNSKALTG